MITAPVSRGGDDITNEVLAGNMPSTKMPNVSENKISYIVIGASFKGDFLLKTPSANVSSIVLAFIVSIQLFLLASLTSLRLNSIFPVSK